MMTEVMSKTLMNRFFSGHTKTFTTLRIVRCPSARGSLQADVSTMFKHRVTTAGPVIGDWHAAGGGKHPTRWAHGSRPLKWTGRHGRFLNLTGVSPGVFFKKILGTNHMAIS